MFNFFKKKKRSAIILEDLNGEPLAEGIKVQSLRYDLEKCTLVKEADEWFYISEKTGEKVSFIKMIDASTKRQKVLLLESK